MAKDPRPAAVCAELFGSSVKMRIIDILLDADLPLPVLAGKLPDVGQTQLEQCLQQLQDADLVKKIVLPRGKVEYGTTMVGDTLEPVFDELRKWGEGYIRMVDAYIK